MSGPRGGRPAAIATPVSQPSDEKDLFTSLSRVLTSSPAFALLTAVEVRLYIALAVRHTGRNNGQIVLGSAAASAEIGCSKPTVLAAFHRLEQLGLVIRRYKGKLLPGANGKISGGSERRASEWELTDFHTWNGDEMVPAARTYTDWCPKAQAIVPGKRSKSLPKPRAGASKAKPATRVPSRPKSPIRRPASVSPTSASSAPPRSQRSEPTIPEPASAAPQRQPDDRTYSLDDILRDDERFLARTGKPRPPTQSRPDGKWWHLGKPITTDQAMAIEAADVPF